MAFSLTPSPTPPTSPSMIIPCFSCLNVRGIIGENRIQYCRCLIMDFKLEFLCKLQNKLQCDATLQIITHRYFNLFSNEDFFSNFYSSICGRISIKWNSNSMTFYPLKANPQQVHGEI